MYFFICFLCILKFQTKASEYQVLNICNGVKQDASWSLRHPSPDIQDQKLGFIMCFITLLTKCVHINPGGDVHVH